MAHSHDHAAAPVSSTVTRRLAAAAVALAVLTVVGTLVLLPTGEDRPDLSLLGVTADVYPGVARAVEEGPCTGTSPSHGVPCTFSTIEMLEGPDAGTTIELELPLTETSPDIDVGDEIVLSRVGDGDYQYADRQRRTVLLALAIVFAIVVIVLGRVRGLAALAGLAASVGVLLWFALPAIIDGRPPLFVAVVAASAIAFFALYLAHGFTPMTTVALIGTLGSLALTALLATVFVWLADFSGFATEEAFYLQAAGGRIDLNGLMLAGVVIGALGAIDDMTVTQASVVWELRSASPSMPVTRLYGAALRIGRDHVASTVNTLLLAYAGASMPLLLLFVLSGQSLGTVANSELVAIEIVRTLVGSIGLVASVPLTTALAALAVPSAGERDDVKSGDAAGAASAAQEGGAGGRGVEPGH